MYLPKCFLALFGLVFLSSEISAVALSTERNSNQPINVGSSVRSLRAARKNTAIRSRDLGRCLAHDLDLHYVDESTHQTPDQFVARVQISAKLPTVVLEEIEHYINVITCFDSSIRLQFDDIDSMELTYEELSQSGTFLVITSHHGCNIDGERVAYSVSGIELDDKDLTIILMTTYTPWKDTVHSVTVDFGASSESFDLHQHHDLRARQFTASSSVVSGGPASSSSTPTVTEISKVFNKQWTDTTILPIPKMNTEWGTVSLSGPAIPAGFTLACKNCTIEGSIDIFSGSFTMNTVNSSSNETENIFEFFENGFVELRSNNFAAHIELETKILPSAQLIKYEANFPAINFLPFQIPGIASVGPQLQPQVKMGLKLFTELDFTYGFDLRVPDDSYVVLDLGNITNSSIKGFSDSSITALPFETHVDSIGLSLVTGFSPELFLGISVFDNHGSMEAGVFLDIPSVSATIEQVFHVDSKCNPASNSSDDGSFLHDIFDSLTNIVPSLHFDVGLFAQADLQGLGVRIDDVTSWQATQTSFPLSTECLSFDRHASTYGPASNTATVSATATGSGSAATATSGAAISMNWLEQVPQRLGRWGSAAAMLAAVFVFITGLL